MKKHITLLLFFVTSVTVSIACLNESGTSMNGEVEHIIDYRSLLAPNNAPSSDRIEEKLAEFRLQLQTSAADNKDDIYTDIAAYMIYDGDYQEAIDYLNTNVIEKESNYNYAANIGVAYELVGNLDSALYWTQRGLEINPDSHHGSEWIHVRILEVKQELEKDSNWLNRNAIFDFDVSQDSTLTVFPSNTDIREFNNQLYFQLHERSYFVKPDQQHPLFAQLLLIHADLYASNIDTKDARPIYGLAEAYDTTLTALIAQRITTITTYEFDNKIQGTYYKRYEYISEDVEQVENLNSEVINDGAEEQPKKKKVIKNLIYYLMAGFVLLAFLLYFFMLRKKTPKK